jgi:hypothetical protein
MATATVTETPAELETPEPTGRLRRYLEGLFPEPEALRRPEAEAGQRPTTAHARRLRRRRWAVATLAVVAGTPISLTRTTGTGPLQTIWEEYARDPLTDALMRPGAFNLLRPYVGYFQVLPRCSPRSRASFRSPGRQRSWSRRP